jgi:hypothetical protein
MDKIIYKFCGLIDNCFAWLESKFKKKKKK